MEKIDCTRENYMHTPHPSLINDKIPEERGIPAHSKIMSDCRYMP